LHACDHCDHAGFDAERKALGSFKLIAWEIEMKEIAAFVALTIALVSSLIAAPAFADADHKYPQLPSVAASANAQAAGATVRKEYGQDGYGNDATSAAQSGVRSASESFMINDRSLYRNP
ncbi:hypothetical protein K6Y33_37270, partial [Burkholderia cenocepacia]